MNRFLLLLIAIAIFVQCKEPMKTDIKITINASQNIHTMKGGMGASWHVITDVMPLNNEKYKYKVREVSPLGSAYGGNPPASDTIAWNQIKIMLHGWDLIL